jgi:Matrixin/Putative Ig domain
VKIFHTLPILSVSLFLFFDAGNNASGFSLEGLAWPAGTEVAMQLGLGPANIALEDGTLTLNSSATDAVNLWNGYLDFIHFSSVSSSTVPQESGDGTNSVFLASNIFGDSFDQNTLAVTVLLNDPSDPAVTSEADVIFNSAFRFGSYRGPLQASSYDFHRIALHEFGHVLGLDHIELEPPGQALMEPFISDVDHLSGDDIGGVRALYGAEILNKPADNYLRVGDSYIFSLLQPNNSPTSYSALGLPPGIVIDSSTGRINGTATTTGVYDIVITAHGPIADADVAFQLVVRDVNEVLGLEAIARSPASSLVADPVRARIYFAGPAGISMLNTETFEVTNLLPGDKGAALLSISADSSALFFTGANGDVRLYKVDLESLTLLPAIEIPSNTSPVFEGLENRAYVAGPSGVSQFDATTGAFQKLFATNPNQGYYAAIAMAPDRRTLFVTRRGTSGELSAYDISTPDPVLLHQLAGSYGEPAPSADGQSICYVEETSGYPTESTQASLPDLSPKPPFAFNYNPVSIALGQDGAIYQSNYTQNFFAGSIAVYDPHSLEPGADIQLAQINPYIDFEPFRSVCDSSGKHFFVSISGYGAGELWIFSTDFAGALPPPVRPTKCLLNISTRALVQSGENAMIGGFIVQGPDPKKVLIRGLGPSLPLTGAMSNPVLDLYDSAGKLLASNDDWGSSRLDIIASQLAPGSPLEAAILVTLQPGAFTAMVHDRDGRPGLALMEVYNLDPAASLLANISTRGRVETGDNVMIGGFIVGGADPGPAYTTQVVIRAIGPSLGSKGIVGPLADPTLDLYDPWGVVVASNDDWRSTQEAEIIASGLAPSDDREAAISTSLLWGSYTAIVRGKGNATGVALVEVYDLQDGGTASN